MNEITREQLLEYHHILTVGDIKKFIEINNIPDDAIIVMERIKDYYFDGCDISGFSGCKDTADGIYPKGSKATGWGGYRKKGESYYNLKNHNEKIDSGEYLNKEEYPLITENDQILNKFSEKDLNEFKDEFYPLNSCAKFNDEPDNKILFLVAHY